MTAAGKVRVAGEEGGRVADCVHRYQSAMLEMRGTRGLARFVRLRCWSRCTRPDEREDTRLVGDGDTSPSQRCRWPALPPSGQDGHAEYGCQLGHDHQRHSRRDCCQLSQMTRHRSTCKKHGPLPSVATQNLSDAWGKAIKTIETLLKPIILPSDNKATLGKMISALRQSPGKWECKLPDRDYKANGETNVKPGIEVFIDVLATIGYQPDRHGSDQPQDIDEATARSVLFLATTVVGWPRDGILRTIHSIEN